MIDPTMPPQRKFESSVKIIVQLITSIENAQSVPVFQTTEYHKYQLNNISLNTNKFELGKKAPAF